MCPLLCSWTHMVIYDRVWNRKNYFEICAFLNFKWRTWRAGKFKWKQKQTTRILGSVTILWNYLLLIFLIQLAERPEFKKKSCSIPYHILTLVELTGTVHESVMLWSGNETRFFRIMSAHFSKMFYRAHCGVHPILFNMRLHILIGHTLNVVEENVNAH